jgi:hypothetical protein
MSEIKLSPELLREVRQALEKNDSETADPGIALQYLAALIGHTLGAENAPEAQKLAYYDELSAFGRHVMQDTIERIERQREAQQQNAFGYWEPPAED